MRDQKPGLLASVSGGETIVNRRGGKALWQGGDRMKGCAGESVQGQGSFSIACMISGALNGPRYFEKLA
jgi:hypothetical protein